MKDKNKARQWQAKIWIGEKVDQPTVIYGSSFADLKSKAAKWLNENKPLAFGNASPEYELSKRINYAYLDGKTKPLFPIKELSIEERFELKMMKGIDTEPPPKEGWYYADGSDPSSSAKPLKDFDAVVTHFINRAIIFEKGPDYQEIPLVEGNLPLHLIKTVKRIEKLPEVNDMLQRGWYIVALEHTGKTTEYGERLISREAVFVLGHPEENAT